MIEKIKQELIQHLSPSLCEIHDFSHRHNGHGSYVKKDSHLHIFLQADIFKNKSQLQQHQLVYEILNPFFAQGLHAVELETSYRPDSV